MKNNSHPFSASGIAGRVHLRILSTTDVHAALRAHDYINDQPNDAVGLTRVASLIRQARAQADNALLVDNGDLLQGNPLGDFVAQHPDEAGPNPFVAVFNALGMDAATVGNHDFNFGLTYLARTLADARYRVVLANIVRKLGETPSQDSPFLAPWTILDRMVIDGSGARVPLRIGVLGVAPPQVVDWEKDRLGGMLTARLPLEAAAAHVPNMKAAGADCIIVLSHGGLGIKAGGEGIENAAIRLAALDGVDAVVMGHVHRVFPTADPLGCVPEVDGPRGLVCGKPAAMAGSEASHLGVIDLALEQSADGAWAVIDTATEARAVAYRDTATGNTVPLVVDDPDIDALTRPIHDKTLRHIRQVVTRIHQPLFSHFSFLGCDPALRAVAGVMRRAARDYLVDTPLAALPIVAAIAPSKAGGLGGADHYTDVDEGPVALRAMADLYAFQDKLVMRQVTGGVLRGWLERSAAAFCTIAHGAQDATLLDPRMPAYHFDTIDGLTYQIDLTQPPRTDPTGTPQPAGGSRIRNLSLNGSPLEDNTPVVLVMTQYRAGGGGGYPIAGDAVPMPDLVQTLLKHNLESISTQALTDPCWTFAPSPGTTAVFHTGPGAVKHLPRVAGLRLDPLGQGLDGFITYRLHL